MPLIPTITISPFSLYLSTIVQSASYATIKIRNPYPIDRVGCLVHATSVSTENLTTVPGIGASSAAGPSATRLQRAPSLPRTYNRNRSGIPVATTPRDANPPTALPSTPHQQQLQPIARGCFPGGCETYVGRGVLFGFFYKCFVFHFGFLPFNLLTFFFWKAPKNGVPFAFVHICHSLPTCCLVFILFLYVTCVFFGFVFSFVSFRFVPLCHFGCYVVALCFLVHCDSNIFILS